MCLQSPPKSTDYNVLFQAPEFFYNYLANKQGLELVDILQLTQELEALK